MSPVAESEPSHSTKENVRLELYTLKIFCSTLKQYT